MSLIGWNIMEMDGMAINITVFAKNSHFETNSSSGSHFDSGGIS